jgi:hypothetical protein
VLLRREAALVALPAALAFQGSTPGPAPAGVSIRHSPPACFVAGEAPRLVACAVPRSQVARLRLYFKAEGAPQWHYVEMASDLPCYAGVLPRPSRATRRVLYFVEATDRAGESRRSEDYAAEVVAGLPACPGPRPLGAGGSRAVSFAASGRREVPPGFEGGAPLAPPAAGGSPLPPSPPAPTEERPRMPPPPSKPTTTEPPSAPPAPASASATASGKEGHGGRTVALVLAGGAAVAGGAVIAARSQGSSASSPAAFIGSPGLPPDGIGGRWMGDESVSYAGGCVGRDQIVVYLSENGGIVTGTFVFSVGDCACCPHSQGASPLAGTLQGTTLQFGTPTGFSYSATVSGTRLQGSLAAPAGITGTWKAERR